VWDVLVIGAGPAGAMAAREAARRGARVLLVDQAPFPRPKVCGGCVNGAALDLLKTVGLSHLAARCGAQPLGAMRVAAGSSQAVVALPGHAALSRELFDAALVEEAIRTGAQFWPSTRAVLGPVVAEARGVMLAQAHGTIANRAHMVLVATGLPRHEPAGETVIAPGSRIGCGAMLDDAPAWYQPGTLFMACGRQGYVGLVRLADGRLDVAAACEPAFVRAQRGPAGAVASLLEEAGWPLPASLARTAWQGTPPLTQRRNAVAAHRLFFIGDAAGYVEPFTGEGIAWALASGASAAVLAARAADRWDPALAAEWMTVHRRLIQRRQRLCRVVSRLLRHPGVIRGCLSALGRVPGAATPLVRALSAPIALPVCP
jgi:flavin-dependent dehydrogenase